MKDKDLTIFSEAQKEKMKELWDNPEDEFWQDI